MENKLEFTLTPVSGALKESGAYRAKFGKNANQVLGLEDVISEAKEDGAFFGISETMMSIFFRGVLQSMIDHTAADGITRRIDDYLSVSLKIHGKFDSADEDFDPDKHTLALSLRPLVKFRPKFKLQPVNVNRKRQFRIYSITAADGSRSNNQVVWNKDFRIKGADMLYGVSEALVSCQMKGPDGVYASVNPEIVSATSSEIVCHWPADYGEGFKRGRMVVSVCKLENNVGTEFDFTERDRYVTVYPD